jgi:biotin carboxylase
MTNNWILILGGGFLAIPMFEKSKALGLKVLAFEWDLEAPALKYADKVMEVNLKDSQDVCKCAKEAGKKYDIGGVVTCGSDIEIAVAVAAETLGLPGIPVQVAMDCNDKVAMRRKLEKAQLNDTQWAEVTSVEEAIAAADDIGYPCFFKPVDNCGSRGCKTIHSARDIQKWWNTAMSYSINAGQCGLIEEYQDGPRQTIEMIVDDGEISLISIIDTHYIYEDPENYHFGNWPVETGLNMTELSEEKQNLLFEHSCKIVQAMGVDFGPVKVDTTITAKGIQTIELTARLSGGFHCQYASPLAYGTDEIQAVIKMAMGEGLDKELIRHKYERAAVVLAKFPKPGKIISISGIQKAEAVEGVQKAFVFCDVGDTAGPYRNSTDRIAFVITDGDTLDAARQSAYAGVSALSIITQEGGM